MTVYEEFKRFCEKNKKEPPTNLQIKKTETVTGRRVVPQTPTKMYQPSGQGYQQYYGKGEQSPREEEGGKEEQNIWQS